MSDVFVIDAEGNIKQSGGSSGVTDHGALTGLGDDDHSQYLLADGNRSLTGDLELGSNELVATEQGSTPSTPAANKRKLYPKADGWYDLDDTGQESGPLGEGGGGAAFNHRQGLRISRIADALLLVDAGSVMAGSTLVEKKLCTAINLATAANWIGGSSLEAASSWVNAYIDAAGNIKLHDTLPNYPVADIASRVATARVNQAGWNGTAGQGLNATSVGYDNGAGGDPDGEGSIAAGMYLGVYTDNDYTQGRGKGSGASGSKNNLSFALITDVDTGTNTLTLAAGHQIAINDNDYLIVVQAGAPLFAYISSAWYRWLGALWNNASSNLTTNCQNFSQYQLDESSNYTTTSTTFVPIDSTQLSLPLVTSGGRIQATFSATLVNSVSSNLLNIALDGALYAANDGYVSAVTYPYGMVEVLDVPIDVLPGSHQLTLHWKVYAGQGTLYAGDGTTGWDLHPVFWVREMN